MQITIKLITKGRIICANPTNSIETTINILLVDKPHASSILFYCSTNVFLLLAISYWGDR